MKKHNKTYKQKATKRIKTKRKWLALAIAVTVGLSIICIADTLTAKSLEPIIENEQIKYGYPVAEDRTDLTVQDQIRIIAKEAGFEWPEYLVRLADCESKFDPYATNMNGGHSLDRGLFQINAKYHPEVSSECAFNVKCSTEWTMNMIENGQQKQWSCDKKIAKK